MKRHVVPIKLLYGYTYIQLIDQNSAAYKQMMVQVFEKYQSLNSANEIISPEFKQCLTG